MNQKKTSIFIGFLLIAAGAIILAGQLGGFIFGWAEIFPLVLLAIAVGNALSVAGGRKNAMFGVLFFGILGVFFFLKNFEFIPHLWFDEYWPIFFTALGFGFLGVYLTKPYDWGSLVPAVTFLLLSAFFFVIELDMWYQFAEIVQVYWPLVLVLGGVALIGVSLKQNHGSHGHS